MRPRGLLRDLDGQPAHPLVRRHLLDAQQCVAFGALSLFPGEATIITAVYETGDLGGHVPHLRVRGHNLPTIEIPAVG